MVMYGVETIGMADSQLQTTRGVIARAAAPAGGGKSVDHTLSAIDGASGTLDPAFDAHVLPIQTWATAWWERWRSVATMPQALAEAILKLNGATGSPWRGVTGPVTTLVASALRIGWIFASTSILVDDLGEFFDISLDPPVVVADAVRRSVRRWRFGRIANAHPQLVPTTTDICAPARPQDPHGRGWDPDSAQSIVLDMSDCIARLCKPQRSRCKVFEAWNPAAKPYLLSAASGGQWPQARLASIRKGVDDSRCQLCFSAVGTLDHRFQCPATCPSGGWQAPPAECQAFLATLSEDRARLLRTRGLLAVRVMVPPPVACDTFRWILAPPETAWSEKWKWFIDGSMLDEPRRFARRTGYAVAVVDEYGHLVAYGCGRPPAWISTAAGAEAWAYCVILQLAPAPPQTITDCLEVRNTLEAGVQAATAGRKRLARVWKQIHTILEGQATTALEKLTWMPAHGSAASIGKALKSDGTLVTALEWRANRLVDALAKSAAGFDRMPRKTLEAIGDASKFAEYSAALRGTVTHYANNSTREAQRRDGTPYQQVVRDSAPPPRVARPRKPPLDCTPAEVVEGGKPPKKRPAPAPEGRAKRARLATEQKWREEANDAAGVARWLARTTLRPGEGPSAAERMQRLQLRMRKQVLARDGQ